MALYSANVQSEVVRFSINDQEPAQDDQAKWTNYFKAMLVFLRQAGYQIDHGFELYISGNLPYGAGLSSSASIEMLMGEILRTEFQLDVSDLELAKLGQRTENEFLGLNSGIMDQFAVRMGKANQAILPAWLKDELAEVKKY